MKLKFKKARNSAPILTAGKHDSLNPADPGKPIETPGERIKRVTAENLLENIKQGYNNGIERVYTSNADAFNIKQISTADPGYSIQYNKLTRHIVIEVCDAVVEVIDLDVTQLRRLRTTVKYINTPGNVGEYGRLLNLIHQLNIIRKDKLHG